MKLHYDHILKADPQRASLLKVLRAVRENDPTVGFDVICQGLEQVQGLFPAAAVTSALMAMHAEQGQQTFVLGEHMTSMLEHTSVVDVSRDELKVPYSTFYLALKGCEHRLWGGSRTRWHRVSGLYVHLDEDTDVFTIMVWAEENERSLMLGDDAHVWARLRLSFRHEDLETNIHKLLTDKNNDRSDPILDPLAQGRDGYSAEVKAVQTETMRAMFRLAINLSLYLASDKPDVVRAEDEHRKKLLRKIESVKSPGKRKKLERQLKQHSKATLIKVGQSIEKRASDSVRAHGSVKAHWVRGHWHTYWTGKGRSVKVRRWVLPYPKGLETPEKRAYKVQGSA